MGLPKLKCVCLRWPKFGLSGHEFLDFESLKSDLKPTLDNLELTARAPTADVFSSLYRVASWTKG